MNTACPDEERLKSLIREAFDELVGPDPARLGQIGARLGKQAQRGEPRRTKGRHWLFWLLLGAAATSTAWWGGKTVLESLSRPATEVIQQQPSREPVAADRRPKEQKTQIQAPVENQADPQQKDSTVIYKREVY